MIWSVESVMIMSNVLDWFGCVVVDLSGIKVISWQKSCFQTENLMMSVRPKSCYDFD